MCLIKWNKRANNLEFRPCNGTATWQQLACQCWRREARQSTCEQHQRVHACSGGFALLPFRHHTTRGFTGSSPAKVWQVATQGFILVTGGRALLPVKIA